METQWSVTVTNVASALDPRYAPLRLAQLDPPPKMVNGASVGTVEPPTFSTGSVSDSDGKEMGAATQLNKSLTNETFAP